MSDRKTSHLVPSWQQIDVMCSVEAALRPLSEFAHVMSADKHPTVSSVVHPMTLLQDIVKDAHDSSECTSLTKDILDHVWQYMSSSDIKMLLAKASLLDPRYKKDYLKEDETSPLSFENVNISILQESPCNSHVGDEPVREVVDDRASQPPQKLLAMTISERLKPRSSQPSTGEQMSDIATEIPLYSNTPVISHDQESLRRWKQHSAQYPMLWKFALKYMCVPASSTSSERLFSYAGMVITSKINRLNPSKSEQLIFLSKNLK